MMGLFTKQFQSMTYHGVKRASFADVVTKKSLTKPVLRSNTMVVSNFSGEEQLKNEIAIR